MQQLIRITMLEIQQKNKKNKYTKIKKRGKCSVCQQRETHPKYKKVPLEK